jgi:histone H3/H4
MSKPDPNGNTMPGKEPLIKEQDRFLPIANIARIMKRAIPENGL